MKLNQKKNRRAHSTNSIFSKKGFTIIELLVAMTVFLILTTIAVTSFVRSLRTQRAVTSLIAINDNTSLTLEQMAREIRTARGFSTVGFSTLRFTNARNEAVTYRISNERVERQAAGGAFVPLTASNIKIADARFLVTAEHDTNGNVIWPRVTISLKVGTFAKELSGVFVTI